MKVDEVTNITFRLKLKANTTIMSNVCQALLVTAHSALAQNKGQTIR